MNISFLFLEEFRYSAATPHFHVVCMRREHQEPFVSCQSKDESYKPEGYIAPYKDFEGVVLYEHLLYRIFVEFCLKESDEHV